MEGKINLITVRNANLEGSVVDDAIVVIDDKRFRVKGTYIKKYTDDGYLNLNETIYRRSNFIIFNEDIHHRIEYIDTGILENGNLPGDPMGVLIYFLIPMTKEDW